MILFRLCTCVYVVSSVCMHVDIVSLIVTRNKLYNINYPNSLYVQLREACRDIRKLAAEGKDINELRKAKQKYITEVRQHVCTYT